MLAVYLIQLAWMNYLILPKWLSLGVIVVTFLAAYLYARQQGPVEDTDDGDEAAAALIGTDSRGQ